VYRREEAVLALEAPPPDQYFADLPPMMSGLSEQRWLADATAISARTPSNVLDGKGS